MRQDLDPIRIEPGDNSLAAIPGKNAGMRIDLQTLRDGEMEKVAGLAIRIDDLH